MKTTGILVLGLMATAWTSAAHATLAGSTVDIEYLKNGSAQAQSSGVIPQSIPLAFGLDQNATISNTQLVLSGQGVGIFYSGGTFGVDVTVLSGPAITDVTLDTLSDVTGYSASDLSFTSGSITLDLTGLQVPFDAVLSFDIQTTDLPEPGRIGLFAFLAVGALALARKARASGSITRPDTPACEAVR